MSTEVGKEAVTELLHYGVKGMKWGVRRQRRADRKADRQDKKFRKNVNSIDTFVRVHNASASHFNSRIEGINDKYKGIDLTSPANRKQREKYDKEVEDLSLASYKHGASTVKSKSGRLQYEAVMEYDGDLGTDKVVIKVKEVEHAGETAAEFKLIRNDKGLVMSIEPVSTSIAQGQAAVGDLLIHYGVKGMKWGVRRKRATSSRVTVTNRKNLGLKAVGGAGRKPSADAKRAKVSGQIAKKSGYQALSNKELQAYIKRMDLEKKAATIDRGNSFVAAFIDALKTQK